MKKRKPGIGHEMRYEGVEILDPVAKEGPCNLRVKARRKRESCGHEDAWGEH